jgi:hypothetical protein
MILGLLFFEDWRTTIRIRPPRAAEVTGSNSWKGCPISAFCHPRHFAILEIGIVL